MSRGRELPRHPGAPPESWARMAMYQDCPACGAELWDVCRGPDDECRDCEGTGAVEQTSGLCACVPAPCPERVDEARQEHAWAWLDDCRRQVERRRRRLAEGTAPGTERVPEEVYE